MPLDAADIARLKSIQDELLTEDFKEYEPLNAPFDKILKQNKRRISRRDQELLTDGTDEEVDRSNLLFALGGRLLERGVPFDHAYVLLQGSPVNKFEGRSDEVQRLYEGLRKVEKKAKVRELKVVKENKNDFPWKDDAEFKLAQFKPPTWLIDGVWVEASKGFIASEPKCGKSTFAFDLALSVATGTPFLGHFGVNKPGRVLVIQEEMDEGEVQWRRRKIMESKGFNNQFSVNQLQEDIFEMDMGQSADVGWLNEAQVKLDLESHQERLEQKIAREKPVMVIFDPLQRMLADADVRSERDMNAIFEWLDRIRREYRTSVVIVHHLKKPTENLGYDDQMRLLGSQALASWYESMLMLTRKDTTIRVRPTFRSKHNLPFEVKIDWGDEDDPIYECEVQGRGSQTTGDALLDLVITHPGITYSEAVEKLGVSERTVRAKAKKLNLRAMRRKSRGDGPPIIELHPPKR